MKTYDLVCSLGPFIMLIVMFLLLKKYSEITFENFNPTINGCNNPPICSNGTKTTYWENSVINDPTGPKWPGGDANGQCRIFKKKNYYGWNTCNNAYSYGEPFYKRCVQY